MAKRCHIDHRLAKETNFFTGPNPPSELAMGGWLRFVHPKAGARAPYRNVPMRNSSAGVELGIIYEERSKT
jgi:hypothetical protein